MFNSNYDNRVVRPRADVHRDPHQQGPLSGHGQGRAFTSAPPSHRHQSHQAHQIQHSVAPVFHQPPRAVIYSTPTPAPVVVTAGYHGRSHRYNPVVVPVPVPHRHGSRTISIGDSFTRFLALCSAVCFCALFLFAALR